MLKELDVSHIGVDQLITHQKPFIHAIGVIENLSKSCNVKDKLKCFQAMEKSYETVIFNINSFESNTKKLTRSTDLTFPIQIYIFLKASISNLWSELNFLNDQIHFVHDNEITEDGRIYKKLADFENALEFISVIDYHVRDESGILIPTNSFIEIMINLIDLYNKDDLKWIIDFLSDLFQKVPLEDHLDEILKKYLTNIENNLEFFEKFAKIIFLKIEKQKSVFKLSYVIKLPYFIYKDITYKISQVLNS